MKAESNPLQEGGCGRADCLVCSNGGKGDCSKSWTGYRILCQECPADNLVASYEGETGRNPYSQGLEHESEFKNENDSSSLWKHCTLQHASRKTKFKMDALRSFRYPMVRQVNEWVRCQN